MTIAETIKQAREGLGLTQEDLAEKLEVSRQAVSKWELGASAPSPENLALLEEALGISFPAPEEPNPQSASKEEPSPQAMPKASFWNWKRVVLLILGALVLLALLSNVIFAALIQERNTNAPVAPAPNDPRITDIAFFDSDAAPLRPDLGDGWNSFPAGERVLMVVEFANGAENPVNAVSLFLTPTGTETFDLREQIAVQAVADGRDFALFAWDIPQDLMGHLEVALECGGGLRVTETLNVTAASFILGSEGSTDLDNPDLVYMPESGISHEPETLVIPSGATLFMDEPYLLLRSPGVPENEIVWTSSNPAVVEVSDIGALFPVSPGTAVVTAEWNGQTAECQVEVFTGTVPTDTPGVSKVV